MKQVRDGQQRSRYTQYFRRFPLRSKQLIQGVDLQELDSGFAVDLFARRPRENFVHHSVRTLVPVVIRILEQLPIIAEQGIIHAPCVHADPRQFMFIHAREGIANFPPKSWGVPAKGCSLVDWLVGNAINLFTGERTGVAAPGYCYPALTAQVEDAIW